MRKIKNKNKQTNENYVFTFWLGWTSEKIIFVFYTSKMLLHIVPLSHFEEVSWDALFVCKRNFDYIILRGEMEEKVLSSTTVT